MAPRYDPGEESTEARRRKDKPLILGDTSRYDVAPARRTATPTVSTPPSSPSTGSTALANYRYAVEGSTGRAGVQTSGVQPIAGRADRVRDDLIQKELIARKQLGTISRDEANAIAGQLRMNRREYGVADSSRRVAPPVRTAGEYAESTRRSDQSLMEQTAALARPLMERVSRGESLSPEESAELARYDKAVEGYRSRLDAERRTDLGNGDYRIDFGPDSDYYAKKGEDVRRAAVARDTAFRDQREAERMIAAEMYDRRARARSDADTMDRARFESALAEERARSRTFNTMPIQDPKDRITNIQADALERQIVRDEAERSDPRSIENREKRNQNWIAALEEQGFSPDAVDSAFVSATEALDAGLSDLVSGRVSGELLTGDASNIIKRVQQLDDVLTSLEQVAPENRPRTAVLARMMRDKLRDKLDGAGEFTSGGGTDWWNAAMQYIGLSAAPGIGPVLGSIVGGKEVIDGGAESRRNLAQTLNETLRRLDRLVSQQP